MPEPLEHVVAVAPPGRLLVEDGAEALRLLRRVVVDPRVDAHVVPDHVHVVGPVGLRAKVLTGLQAWARSRSGRGVPGPHVRLLPERAPATTAAHIRRTRRYVHLQWVHDGLVRDALASPYGTLLDRLGLTLDPLVPKARDPERLWAYVRQHDAACSGDLPASASPPLPPERVFAAVTVALRVPGSRLGERGRPRAVWVGALRQLCMLSGSDAARVAGVHKASVYRTPALAPEQCEVLSRLAADPRVSALGGPLPSSASLRARLEHHADPRGGERLRWLPNPAFHPPHPPGIGQWRPS